jgi:hypothetical protein
LRQNARRICPQLEAEFLHPTSNPFGLRVHRPPGCVLDGVDDEVRHHLLDARGIERRPEVVRNLPLGVWC